MRSKSLYYLFALAIAFSTYSGLFNFGSLFYIIIIFLFLLFTLIFTRLNKKVKVGSVELLLFLCVCVFSIIYNQPPSYFQSWNRLLVFVIVLLAFSPLVVSHSLNKCRELLYYSTFYVLILFSVASFIGYFFGINYFIRGGELLAYNEVGHFSGFTNHSMVLAPVSSLGGLFALSQMLKNRHVKNRRIIWFVIMIICFGSLLLSASRGALGGCILGAVFMTYKYYSGKMSAFLRISLIAVAVAAATFPIWGGLAQYVILKNETNISGGSVIYSRESKIDARLYEIRNNFFTGVGFSVVDESVDIVDHVKGTVEPNSSWLGVFSMTGVFGFLFFLCLFIRALIMSYKKIPDKDTAVLLCGVLAFFLVHMLIEGYILAAGNFLCGYYWLTLGVIFANSKPMRKRMTIL